MPLLCHLISSLFFLSALFCFFISSFLCHLLPRGLSLSASGFSLTTFPHIFPSFACLSLLHTTSPPAPQEAQAGVCPLACCWSFPHASSVSLCHMTWIASFLLHTLSAPTSTGSCTVLHLCAVDGSTTHLLPLGFCTCTFLCHRCRLPATLFSRTWISATFYPLFVARNAGFCHLGRSVISLCLFFHTWHRLHCRSFSFHVSALHTFLLHYLFLPLYLSLSLHAHLTRGISFPLTHLPPLSFGWVVISLHWNLLWISHCTPHVEPLLLSLQTAPSHIVCVTSSPITSYRTLLSAHCRILNTSAHCCRWVLPALFPLSPLWCTATAPFFLHVSLLSADYLSKRYLHTCVRFSAILF